MGECFESRWEEEFCNFYCLAFTLVLPFRILFQHNLFRKWRVRDAAGTERQPGTHGRRPGPGCAEKRGPWGLWDGASWWVRFEGWCSLESFFTQWLSSKFERVKGTVRWKIPWGVSNVFGNQEHWLGTSRTQEDESHCLDSFKVCAWICVYIYNITK